MPSKALSLCLCIIALSFTAFAAKNDSTVASLPPQAQSIIAAAVAANNRTEYNAPWVKQATLTPSDPQDVYGFGLYSVAIDGDTIVVGVPFYGGEFGGLFVNQGAAYVFVKTGASWTTMTQAAVLTASDAATDALLGTGVAIVGDTIAVGAPAAGNLVPAVYIFVKPSTGWANMTQTAKLTASDGGMAARTVSMSGNTIVASAPNGTVAGYVFVEPPSGWTNMTQTAELTLTTSSGLGNHGPIAIDGSTVAVSAGKNINNRNVGKVAVYVKPAGGWRNMTPTAVLSPTDIGSTLTPVAIRGNVIAAGDAGAVTNGQIAAGNVHVFVEPAGGWINATQTAVLTASDAALNNELGYSVAVDGNTIVAGAPGTTINKHSFAGAAYVFTAPPSGWVNTTESDKFYFPDGYSAALGDAVTIQGNTIVTSAPYTNEGIQQYVGEALIFQQ